GAWDVFEDPNHNYQFDLGEDVDQDGQWNWEGCEGATREDKDCDGHLDDRNEDANHNGILDPGEDLDFDRHLDLGDEHRNHNHILDDRPFPQPTDTIYGFDPNGNPVLLPPTYPYTSLRPLPRDQVYTIRSLRTGTRTTGPYYIDFAGQRGRVTLRQDLTVFLPDWHGQHDLRFGGVVERERYAENTDRRPIYYPIPRGPGT